MPDPLNEAHCCVTSMGTDPNAHDPDCEVGTPASVLGSQDNEQENSVRVPTVHEDGDSLEHYTFAAILRRMYARHVVLHPDADLSGEVGIHRLVFRSPFDPEGRRQTTFARVGDGNAFIRHYILHPYTVAKNGRADDIREVEDVYAVLSGQRLGELLGNETSLPDGSGEPS